MKALTEELEPSCFSTVSHPFTFLQTYLEGSKDSGLSSLCYSCDPGSVEEALEEMKRFWDSYLDVLQVSTPDPAFDSTVNIHNPHQCHTTRQWSRYLSYYQLGLGARGIGMRDSSQDILGVMANDPRDAKEFLKTLLSFQKQNGSALHQFNPLTLEGSIGDSAEQEDRPHYYSDDHLWSVLCVTAYIKETGDVSFLDEVIPYYEKDKEGKPLLSSYFPATQVAATLTKPACAGWK